MNTQARQKLPGAELTKALQAKISQAYASQSRQIVEEQWIVVHLPMVRHIAGKVTSYIPQEADMDDLISAGTLGLVRAARAYDPDRDTEFRTYAYIRIRGAIIDELRSKSFVPTTVFREMRRIEQAYDRHLSETGLPPDDAELAGAVGLSEEKLHQTFCKARSQHFLSIHGLTDDAPAMGALMPVAREASPGQQAERRELLAKMAQAIADLPKRDRILLLLYYERELSMKEIAAVLEVTESRVSQLHAAALFKLHMKLEHDQ